MPQATEAQRAKWGTDGGVGEEKAISFLESRGFKLHRDWQWELPNSNHEITQDEFEAACFLVDEWDFGGFVKGERANG